jgi:hypothetical protein
LGIHGGYMLIVQGYMRRCRLDVSRQAGLGALKADWLVLGFAINRRGSVHLGEKRVAGVNGKREG